MTNTKKTRGPAFPLVEPNEPCAVCPGMSLRDWFAGQAMKSFLLADGTTNFDQRAKEAYEMADAMLAAREESE